MALLTAVAGAYTGTWTPAASNGASGAGGGATSVGILADDGFELSWVVHEQTIGNDGTDQYGNTLLETIYRGADWRMRFLCREYAVANMNAAWTWGRTGSAALYPILGVIARLGYDTSGVLIMTATASTPSATNPASLTASKCQMASGTQFGLSFTSKIRQTPVNLVLLPYTVSSTVAWFVTT